MFFKTIQLHLAAGSSSGGYVQRVQISNGSTITTDISTTNQIEINVWKYHVFVYDSNNGTIKIYVDGVEEASGTVSQPIPLLKRGNSYIGNDNAWSGTAVLGGVIKSVNIWESALTQADIQYLFNKGRNYNVIDAPNAHTRILPAISNINLHGSMPGLRSNLSHSYYFTEGYTCNDQVGGQKTTLINSPTIDKDGVNLIRTSSQALDIGNVRSLGPQSTTAIWFNMHSSYLWQRLFNFTNSTGAGPAFAVTQSSGSIFQTWINDTMDFTITYNKWTHLVIVFDKASNNQRMYVDGSLQHTNNVNSWNNFEYGHVYKNSTLGADELVNNRDYIDAQIKSFNMWERSLSTEEVATLYSYGRDYNPAQYNAVAGNPDQTVAPVQTIKSNDWFHFAVTNKKMTDHYLQSLYINNNKVWDASYAAITTNHTNPFIFGQGMQGFLTDLRVFNRALETADISGVYNDAKLMGTEVLSIATGGFDKYPNTTTFQDFQIERTGVFESDLVEVSSIRAEQVQPDLYARQIATVSVDNFISAVRRDNPPLYLQSGNSFIEKTAFVNTIDGSTNPVTVVMDTYSATPTTTFDISYTFYDELRPILGKHHETYRVNVSSNYNTSTLLDSYYAMDLNIPVSDISSGMNIAFNTSTFNTTKTNQHEIRSYRPNNEWNLITEISQGAPINNPWSGERTASAAPVHIPLNTMSSGNGEDLEIKIEWTNDDGTISKRFYKGWPLNYVFDYTNANDDVSVTLPASDITVYAKWSEEGSWYSNSQRILFNNRGYDWSFSEGGGSTKANNEDMTGDIGFNNVGFLLHGDYATSTWDIASRIYSGEDENSSSKYNASTTWSSIRVYARKVNPGQDIYSTTYSITPSQSTSLFDICGSFIDRREIIPTRTNVPKTVAQFTKTTGNYLQIPNISLFNSQTLTISLWVRFDSPVTQDYIHLVSRFITVTSGIYIGNGAGAHRNKFLLMFGNSGTNTSIYHNDVAIVSGLWYNLTATYENNHAKFYVNGVLGEENASVTYAPSPRAMSLGATSQHTPPIQRFDGKMSDFRFYDTALTRGEVEHLYRGLHKNINSLIYPKLHIPMNNSSDITSNAMIHSSTITNGLQIENVNNVTATTDTLPFQGYSEAYKDISRNVFVNDFIKEVQLIGHSTDYVNLGDSYRTGNLNNDYEWILVTELAQSQPINNPWTGTGEANSPPVYYPLNKLSTQNGRDLEIKIEFTHDSGNVISKRFYKGWYLNEVFAYDSTTYAGTVGVVYAKFSEDKPWYASTQYMRRNDYRWEWCFLDGAESTYSKTQFEETPTQMTGKIGFDNVGFLLRGTSSYGIYSGQDEHGSYTDSKTWTTVRVYVKQLVNAHKEFALSSALDKEILIDAEHTIPDSTQMNTSGTFTDNYVMKQSIPRTVGNFYYENRTRYLEIMFDQALQTPTFTISIWCKPIKVGTSHEILMVSNSGRSVLIILVRVFEYGATVIIHLLMFNMTV